MTRSYRQAVADSEVKGIDYIPKKPTYTQQYSQLYFCRLLQLRPIARRQSETLWPDIAEAGLVFDRILDAQGHVGREVVIVGNLFCQLPGKPNVMKELDEGAHLSNLLYPSSYLGAPEGTQVFLEDEYGRIELTFYDNKKIPMITGMTVAIKGSFRDGEFACADFCLPGIPNSPKAGMSLPGHILAISNLRFGSSPSVDAAFDRLVEMIAGEFSGILSEELETRLRNLKALIVIGDIVNISTRLDDATKRKYGYEHVHFDLSSLRELDDRLALLCKLVHVIVVPGPNDPTSHSLPQAPIKKGILPKSSSNSTFMCVQNPCEVLVKDTRLLLSAGQNLDDMARYCPSTMSKLDLADLNLHCRHIAPTAPDTILCYPFVEKDPFVIEACPHLYVVGGQDSFSWRRGEDSNSVPYNITLLPSFVDTMSAVFMDTSDLSSLEIDFH